MRSLLDHEHVTRAAEGVIDNHAFDMHPSVERRGEEHGLARADLRPGGTLDRPHDDPPAVEREPGVVPGRGVPALVRQEHVLPQDVVNLGVQR